MKLFNIAIVTAAIALSACSSAVHHQTDSTPPTKPAYTVMSTVHFATRSAALDRSAKQILSKAATTLKQDQALQVEIAGHADSRNTNAFNMALSERRAASVERFLIKQGVWAERLTIKAYGESRPIASNDTKAGMAKNRRVELRSH